ncbi:hypothetical protein RHS01_04106 [Rhizoctonia solani]|uniref:Uncharacterized protein n=1 Tax=Rhizoctonia solani TaxID=456999 RepID=A0A8H7M6I5_9AGAM|nr:hypothetical protein RHS01_04106 [Rhizoctonia solani]
MENLRGVTITRGLCGLALGLEGGGGGTSIVRALDARLAGLVGDLGLLVLAPPSLLLLVGLGTSLRFVNPDVDVDGPSARLDGVPSDRRVVVEATGIITQEGSKRGAHPIVTEPLYIQPSTAT